MSWVPTIVRLALLTLLVAFLVRPEWFEPLLVPLTRNNAPAIYNQGSLLALAGQHLVTVAIASVAAAVVAIGMAILVTREAGAEFLPLARSVVNVGQTFPPLNSITSCPLSAATASRAPAPTTKATKTKHEIHFPLIASPLLLSILLGNKTPAPIRPN